MCPRTRGLTNHPTTCQGMIRLPLGEILLNLTGHRAGFHPPGHLSLSLRIGLYNTDPRTGHLGTGHRTGHHGTGHRIGHLDINHRAGHLDTSHRAGHLGIDLRAGHIVPDLVIGLILEISILPLEGIGLRLSTNILDLNARGIIVIRAPVLTARLLDPDLSLSVLSGQSLQTETGTIRGKSLTDAILFLLIEGTRHKHSSGSRHRGRARSSSRDRSHKTMSQRSHSKSDREDDLSIIVDKNDFEGESGAGSPRKASFKPLKKQSFDRGTSDSEEEEEATISFAEEIQEVMILLSPEFCPRKESSETIQRPRSTLDALNPTEDKKSASLPQSLLIKDIVNVFQSLIDKKVKLEPGWVTNQSLERELGIVMKYYRSHGQLFPTNVPKIDKDASLLDLASSGNVNFPVKSLETMERQARNMVTRMQTFSLRHQSKL